MSSKSPSTMLTLATRTTRVPSERSSDSPLSTCGAEVPAARKREGARGRADGERDCSADAGAAFWVRGALRLLREIRKPRGEERGEDLLEQVPNRLGFALAPQREIHVCLAL